MLYRVFSKLLIQPSLYAENLSLASHCLWGNTWTHWVTAQGLLYHIGGPAILHLHKHLVHPVLSPLTALFLCVHREKCLFIHRDPCQRLPFLGPLLWCHMYFSLNVFLSMFRIALSLFKCMSVWVCLADLAWEFLQDKDHVLVNLCKPSAWLWAWCKVGCNECLWSKCNFRPSAFLKPRTLKLKIFKSLAKCRRHQETL